MQDLSENDSSIVFFLIRIIIFNSIFMLNFYYN